MIVDCSKVMKWMIHDTNNEKCHNCILYCICKGGACPYSSKQQEFITACSPDTYVLCINMDDTLSYIKRTIKYLESVFPSKVIALCINDISHPICFIRLLGMRIKYRILFGKKIFRISSEKELNKLAKFVIYYK